MHDTLLPIRRHVFLTGSRQVGKSTLLRELINARQLECAGFETRHFDIDGLRRAHILHGLICMPEYENDCICCVRVNANRSVGVPCVFDTNGAEILRRSIASSAPYILMDELGRLEKESAHFISEVFAALDSDKRVLGVLQQCDAPHIEAIRQRNDVTVIPVTEQNRDALLSWLTKHY